MLPFRIRRAPQTKLPRGTPRPGTTRPRSVAPRATSLEPGRAQRVAGHAARLSRHGWRRVSTAVATANSGGRISRPVGAVWQRVARRPPGSNGPTGENLHAHRNRRLAFDFAVLAAAAALLLMLHHTFRPHGRPRLATAFAATSDPSVDAASAQALRTRHLTSIADAHTGPRLLLLWRTHAQSTLTPAIRSRWVTHIMTPTRIRRSTAAQISAITRMPGIAPIIPSFRPLKCPGSLPRTTRSFTKQ